MTNGFEPQRDSDRDREYLEINRQLMSTAKFIAGKEGAIKIYDWKTHKWDIVGDRQPQQGKPLVLLPNWVDSSDKLSYGSGFAEAAADTLFASMIQENKNATGKLFASPMHFVGFGQGSVVNSEIIQRLGVFFPNAGGTSPENRDLQMTTIDPHDYDAESPRHGSLEYVFDPIVFAWENVTYADNYYQDFSQLRGKKIDSADWNVGLSRPMVGFNKFDDPGHMNALGWYMRQSLAGRVQTPQII